MKSSIPILFFSIFISQTCLLKDPLNAATPVTDLATQNGFQLVQRGQDFAVLRKVTPAIGQPGSVTLKTNQVTILDHGIHYFDDGQWKESQDVVESFPGGAIARYGAYRTIFSPDMATPAVFEIQTPEGPLVSGGVRSLQITDLATGKSVTLGSVKASVPAEIIPPNQVVYRSAFDGVEADVVYLWRHHALIQSVVLREKVGALPAELSPDTSRLEVVTEIVDSPAPSFSPRVLRQAGKVDVLDHGLISFGWLTAVPGKAFPLSGSQAFNLSGANLADPQALTVVKQWSQPGDGRSFVIESLEWTEIETHLNELPANQHVEVRQLSRRQVAQARVWPKKLPVRDNKRPIEVASLPYKEKGYLVDLTLSGTYSSYTFLTYDPAYPDYTTYYIPTTLTINSSTTFQPDCVIKYAPGASLTVSGTLNYPASGTAYLTARDDDTVGGEAPGSTHNPSGFYAGLALQLYYVSSGHTIKNFQIRWAQKAIDDYSPDATHTIRDCQFMKCSQGVGAYFCTVNVENCVMLEVTTHKFDYGYDVINFSGLMTGGAIANSSYTSGNQVEPAVAVRELGGGQTKIVAVAMHRPGFPDRGLLQMVSSDGGITWTPSVIANGGGSLVQANSDPALEYDAFGNLFLTYLTYPNITAALYYSINDGQTFQPVPGFDGSGSCDLPRLASGPSGTGAPGSLWVSYSQNDQIKAAGIAVYGLGDIRTPWTTKVMPPVGGRKISTIAIGPLGEVMVVHETGGDTQRNPPLTLYTTVDDDGLGSAYDFVARDTFQINLGWEPIPAQGVYLPGDPQPPSVIIPFPTLVWDRPRNKVYVSYPDKTAINPTDRNTDIYVRYSTDKGVTGPQNGRRKTHC